MTSIERILPDMVMTQVNRCVARLFSSLRHSVFLSHIAKIKQKMGAFKFNTTNMIQKEAQILLDSISKCERNWVTSTKKYIFTGNRKRIFVNQNFLLAKTVKRR